ncbi:MAG: helix-turn-helix domain-containing protein [Bacillota bacterium]|nr:helix-turn-helix domain-containing protein [Bacillota bacterium]
MDWLDRMNGAINYIEENLTGEINLEEVAKIACCSVYHFQRMFSFITEVPLSDYIRRRRLTLAAFELQNSEIKIIDLAMKYSYDSPVSFTRAFQNIHGVTPTIAREKGVQLKAYPRLSFHISIKGDMEMNYRIEEAEASKVFGKSVKVSYHETEQYEEIRKFVAESIENGTVQSILDVMNYGPFEELTNETIIGDKSDRPLGGLFTFYGFEKDGFRFMVAGDYPGQGVPSGFEVLEIPKATWAVFSMHGKANDHEELDTITNIWKRLPEWFQTSGYEHMSKLPEIEKRFLTKKGYLAEVWVPVEKR